MDRLRAQIEWQADCLAVAAALLRLRRYEMAAGKIRAAKDRCIAAHDRAVDRIVAELDKATAKAPGIEKEGVAAVALVHASLEQTRAEVREITSEFATQTNGPPGPLPGSDDSDSPRDQGEPQASWQRGSGQG